MASARGLVADYGEKSLLYDELKCWEQDYGKEGDAKKSLESLSRTIGELELGCAEEISGLEKKTKEMIELVSSLSLTRFHMTDLMRLFAHPGVQFGLYLRGPEINFNGSKHEATQLDYGKI